jgi:phage baseplate assembly protein W
MAVRYRAGIDQTNGQLLVGMAHVNQSIAKILTTRPLELVMLLAFGTNLIGEIGKNLYAGEALRIYAIVVGSIHQWEPEFRVTSMRLVSATRVGGLALALAGTYFPEGRFGNYAISEAASLNIPLVAATQGLAA